MGDAEQIRERDASGRALQQDTQRQRLPMQPPTEGAPGVGHRAVAALGARLRRSWVAATGMQSSVAVGSRLVRGEKRRGKGQAQPFARWLWQLPSHTAALDPHLLASSALGAQQHGAGHAGSAKGQSGGGGAAAGQGCGRGPAGGEGGLHGGFCRVEQWAAKKKAEGGAEAPTSSGAAERQRSQRAAAKLACSAVPSPLSDVLQRSRQLFWSVIQS